MLDYLRIISFQERITLQHIVLQQCQTYMHLMLCTYVTGFRD